MTVSEITIRPAGERDVPGILAIYNDAIANSTATFDEEPQTLEEKRAWLRLHQPPHAVIVAVRGDEVLGFGCLSPFRPKAAYRYTAENSVYVREDARGAGIGKALLARLLQIARENGFRTVIARITSDNPTSLSLHKALGFETVGIEREVGYKFGRWLDVVVMQAMLSSR